MGVSNNNNYPSQSVGADNKTLEIAPQVSRQTQKLDPASRIQSGFANFLGAAAGLGKELAGSLGMSTVASAIGKAQQGIVAADTTGPQNIHGTTPVRSSYAGMGAAPQVSVGSEMALGAGSQGLSGLTGGGTTPVGFGGGTTSTGMGGLGGLTGGGVGGAGGGNSSMGTAQGLVEQQQNFNLQFLFLQSAMQQENQKFSTLSNVMKTRHDTVKNSISNIR